MLKTISKIIVWSLLSLILLFITGIVLAVIMNFRMRSTAEALLRDLRSLKVGESTTADVQRIVEHYHGVKGDVGWLDKCPYSDEFYYVQIRRDNLFLAVDRFPFLRNFGVQPWMAGATFVLENGRVCGADYLLSVQSAAYAINPGGPNLDLDGKMIPSWRKWMVDYRRTPGLTVPPEYTEESLGKPDPHHFYYYVRRFDYRTYRNFFSHGLMAEVQPDGSKDAETPAR